MHLQRLRVSHLRSLAQIDLELGPQLNVFVGANGAGKTSVLEAVYLLSRGRSFRAGQADVLPTFGHDSLHVYGEVVDDHGAIHRLGLGRDHGRWQIQVQGVAKKSRAALLRHCPVVCFEPGSHALIAGGSDGRRRFADWGVFHVEHTFLAHWQRYQRALQQRNALLRQAAADHELLPWEAEMTDAAAAMDVARNAYLTPFGERLADEVAVLIPALGEVQLHYSRGWDSAMAFDTCLVQSRPRDRARGHTTLGAHRADWRLQFARAPAREHLSRGQEKLVVLACILAQARLYAELTGHWPIVCLDDLGSELDADRRASLIQRLLISGAQVWITATESSADLAGSGARLFHVEHGTIQAAR